MSLSNVTKLLQHWQYRTQQPRGNEIHRAGIKRIGIRNDTLSRRDRYVTIYQCYRFTCDNCPTPLIKYRRVSRNFFILPIDIHRPRGILLLHTQTCRLKYGTPALYMCRLYFFPERENSKSQHFTLTTLAGWSITLNLHGKGRHCWTLLGIRNFRKATARIILKWFSELLSRTRPVYLQRTTWSHSFLACLKSRTF
jgi:hypothetical protein